MLADDLGLLEPCGDDTWRVPPAYPRLRLWPSTLQGLGLDEAWVSSPVMSFGEKRYLDLTQGALRFAAHACALRAILVLAPREGATPVITRLAPGSALVALLTQVYAPRAGGIAARQRDLALLTAVCRSVPVYRIALPEAMNWLRSDSITILQSLPW